MYTENLLSSLICIKKARSYRISSWDKTGRNADRWIIPARKTKILVDIKGTGCINHIWMTQGSGYRDVLIKIYWDNEKYPSVLCPLGDFFGLGLLFNEDYNYRFMQIIITA